MNSRHLSTLDPGILAEKYWRRPFYLQIQKRRPSSKLRISVTRIVSDKGLYWGAWGGSGLPAPVLLGEGPSVCPQSPGATESTLSDLRPSTPTLPCCSAVAAALLQPFWNWTFPNWWQTTFFVEIHSPWQSSRAHGNTYLFDLALVWLALYLVCFALCGSFSLQIFMFRFLGPHL